MANATQNNPFPSGFRLIDGQQLNNVLAADVVSSQTGIVAHSGGGKTAAFPLSATLNRVSTAAAAADSVLLPPAGAGLRITIINDSANSIQVFGSGTDTINGVATGTGVLQVAGSQVIYTSTAAGAYTSGSSLPAGASGTFTANGATPVTVTNANVTANSQVLVTLKTVGGTVGTSAPNVRTITAGTGFTIAGIALDTSIYNYSIIG